MIIVAEPNNLMRGGGTYFANLDPDLWFIMCFSRRSLKTYCSGLINPNRNLGEKIVTIKLSFKKYALHSATPSSYFYTSSTFFLSTTHDLYTSPSPHKKQHQMVYTIRYSIVPCCGTRGTIKPWTGLKLLLLYGQ